MIKNNTFTLSEYSGIDALPLFKSFNEKDFILEEIGEQICIPVARIELWQDYIDLFNEGFKGKNYIFRGQMHPKWTLTPTLNRTHKSLSEKDLNTIIDIFRESLKGIQHSDLKNLNSLDINQLWSLGRHYGLPTPILDWSYSPLIALYFAYENRANLLPYHSLYIFDKDKYINDNLIFFDNSPNQNEREKIQMGCYVKIVNAINLETLIASDPQNYTYFRKIYIKANAPAKCLQILNESYGYSKLSLYPNSIEGAVEYCKTHIPSPYEYTGTVIKFLQEVKPPSIKE